MKRSLILLFLFLPASLAWGQCRPTGARVCVAGDDITQVWVNGAYLGQREFCDGRSGCGPGKLCLPMDLDLIQGPLICLTLRTENNNPTRVYTSWELEVDCEGRPPFVMNSSDPVKSQIRLYWDPNGGGSCGAGAAPLSDESGHSWMLFQYDPASNPFSRTGVPISANTYTAAQIRSAQTGDLLPYLSYDTSANGSGPSQGCGVLYWRQVAAPPHFLPTYSPTPYLTPTPTRSTTPTPTATRSPTPFIPWTPTRTWTRWPTFTPWPRLVPTATPWALPTRAQAWPTLPPMVMPAPRPTDTPIPLPAVPVYAPPVSLPRAAVPTPMPRVQAVPTQVPVQAPQARPQGMPRGLPPAERTETLVFSTFPAAFLVTFDTGPGHYQLEVVDAKLKAVEVIYDHKVTNEQNAWVEWDGKNKMRYDMPVGQYYVVYFKDRKPIKTLPIAKTNPPR
ncbi:MAG TPA: hypothetical protein VHE12_05185 [bacterium]|nr:hypothetical protein [bacterium]